MNDYKVTDSSMGDVTAIADRVGHESIEITYRYAHLFPSKQTEMADKLNIERKGSLS